MIYLVDRIVRDVRVCLDENRTGEALLTEGDAETLTLDEIIRSKIVEGVERVHCAAPYPLLEQGHNFEGAADAVYWGELESGWVRPVCAVVQRPEGLALEFYSCKTTEATISKAVYIPHAEIDSGGGVDISERCYQAVVYTIAGLTMTTCGEAEKATVLFDMAKTNMER